MTRIFSGGSFITAPPMMSRMMWLPWLPSVSV